MNSKKIFQHFFRQIFCPIFFGFSVLVIFNGFSVLARFSRFRRFSRFSVLDLDQFAPFNFRHPGSEN